MADLQEHYDGYTDLPWAGGAYDAQWRAEDLEQRTLDNARDLWERHVNDTRQAVDEHAEYVRNMANLAAFMAGFINVAFVQFGFDPTQQSMAVLMGFAVTNALTMALNTCCMAMCTLILASIFRTYTAMLSEEEEANYIIQCREFARGYQKGSRPPAPLRSFRSHWDFFCRAEWHRALFMFSAGIACFLSNVGFAGFIKFQPYKTAAVVLCAALAPGLAYCIVQHLRWMRHLLSSRLARPLDVEVQKKPMGMPFDWHLPGSRDLKAAAAVGVPSSPTGWSPEPFREQKPVPEWRKDTLDQRMLQNAAYLWQRFVSKTRNEVEERVEQLRSFSFLSGLLAGFAVASLLQLRFDVDTTDNRLQLCFAVSAAITAACSTCSMAMCSLMLMSIIKTGRGLVSEEEESIFLSSCFEFANNYKPGSRPPAPKRTLRNHWVTRCEGEWTRAFYLFSLALATFVINMISSAWIKYDPYHSVAIVSNVIMGIALIYLIQAHSRWAPYLTGSRRSSRTQALMEAHLPPPPAGLPWDWHQPPIPPVASKRALRSRPTLQKSSTLRRLSATFNRVSTMVFIDPEDELEEADAPFATNGEQGSP